jgi:hypothetical protein
MATNAYGQDFYVGQVFHSKDKREEWRHVIIADIRRLVAACQTHSPRTGQTWSRKTRISLKGLAERWEPCNENRPCGFCSPPLNLPANTWDSSRTPESSLQPETESEESACSDIDAVLIARNGKR